MRRYNLFANCGIIILYGLFTNYGIIKTNGLFYNYGIYNAPYNSIYFHLLVFFICMIHLSKIVYIVPVDLF